MTAESFEERRVRLLSDRRHRQEQFDQRVLPGFLAETEYIRRGDWVAAPIPPELLDRRVEITGPTDRKMMINALNSGANVFLADFEDANAPTGATASKASAIFATPICAPSAGAVRRASIYQLNRTRRCCLCGRAGGTWWKSTFVVSGMPISASLFDFGLYFFHNFQILLQRRSAPYFYLPKLESHHEARLWNDVFLFAEEYAGVPKGTIRATVLIETIPAAFEMDEILYELAPALRRPELRALGLHLQLHQEIPEPGRVCTAGSRRHHHGAAFLRSYVELLIHTCHRRGVHAMGGMAADHPSAAMRGPTRRLWDACARTSCAKCAPDTTGPGSRIRGWFRWLAKVFDEHMKGGIKFMPAETECASPRSTCCRSRREVTEAGVRQQHRCGAAVPRVLAARQWLRAHLQPDGRRCDGGNLQSSALAVDSSWRAHGGWQEGDRGVGTRRHCGGVASHPNHRWGRTLPAGELRAGHDAAPSRRATKGLDRLPDPRRLRVSPLKLLQRVFSH